MRSFRKNLTQGAVVAVGAMSLGVLGASAASAQPASSVTPTSGNDTTSHISITIPATSTCSGDDTGGSANNYQIFPYIIPASESPQSIRYTGGSIQSLTWFTDDALDSFNFYAPGAGNHAVSQPANLDWDGYAQNSDYGVGGADLQPGTYNVGEVCIDTSSANNPSGAPDIPGNGDPTQNGSENFWNTQFTFTTSGTNNPNPIDFTWTATVGTGNQTPEAPLAIALPLSFLGLAGAGAVVLRRRRHRAAVTA
jgi:MYXO-CTERM domain-containing protein